MEEKLPMIEFVWLYAKWKDLVRNGLFDEALDLLNATIKSQQDQSPVRYTSTLILLKGDTYRKMKRYAEAIYQYKKAHSVEASDLLLSSIAECYWMMGDHEQAAREIAKVTMPYVVKSYEYWKQYIAEREGR